MLKGDQWNSPGENRNWDVSPEMKRIRFKIECDITLRAKLILYNIKMDFTEHIVQSQLWKTILNCFIFLIYYFIDHGKKMKKKVVSDYRIMELVSKAPETLKDLETQDNIEESMSSHFCIRQV